MARHARARAGIHALVAESKKRGWPDEAGHDGGWIMSKASSTSVRGASEAIQGHETVWIVCRKRSSQ